MLKIKRMKISEDQNEITTNDGLVHVFTQTLGLLVCLKCSTANYCDGDNIPWSRELRKDNKDGYFKLK